MSFESTVTSYCEERRLFSGVKRVLLAVSGGVDSLSLLYFMMGQDDLYIEVIYCDHGLRDVSEIQKDQGVIRSVLGGSGLVFHVKVLQIDSSGIGVECAAREARLNAYQEILSNSELDAVVMAHHRDDLCETMLMQLSKGAKSRLYGILPRQILYGMSILRPFLGVTKSEILEYAAEHGLTYSDDSTNLSAPYIRNQCREKVMPALEDVFPAYRTAFARFSQYMQDRLGFEQRILAPYWAFVSYFPGGLKCRLEGLSDMDPFLRQQFLLQFIEAVSPSVRIEGSHLESILQCDALGTNKKNFELPEGLRFELNSKYWVLYQLSAEIDRFEPQEIQIGEVYRSFLGEMSLSTKRLTAYVDPALRVRGSEILDLDCLSEGSLSIRYPQEGDVFWPLGADAPVSLDVFLQKQGLLKRERENVALLYSGATIVWVVGCRLSEQVRISPNTRRFLYLEFSREDS